VTTGRGWRGRPTPGLAHPAVGIARPTIALVSIVPPLGLPFCLIEWRVLVNAGAAARSTQGPEPCKDHSRALPVVASDDGAQTALPRHNLTATRQTSGRPPPCPFRPQQAHGPAGTLFREDVLPREI